MRLKNQSKIGVQIIRGFRTIDSINIKYKPLKINVMKKFMLFSLALLAMFTLTGCDAIGTIFEAGMWWGIFLVAIVIGLIFWLLGRGRK